MWDLIKDYTNAFLGAIALLLSLIFIPEIRNSKKNIFFVLLVCIMSTFLGLDKLKRDNCKDVRNQTRTLKDSETIQNINSTLSFMSANYKRDTVAFADFKKEMMTKFHIKDENNSPVKIDNYNTYIDKAGPVHIGPGN
jgi:hypothetical protein